MRVSHVGVVMVAGVLVVGLAGCGQQEAQAARVAGDKKLTIYSGRSESLVKPLLTRFEKASGIKVEVRYADTAQLAAQLTEEGAAKTRADVFFAQDAGALGAVTRKRLFAALPAEVLGKVPAEFRAKDGTWVGVTGRSRVLVYNTDQVAGADLPKSVFEVTGAKWRGRIGVAPTNGSFQAFVTAIRVTHGDARAAEFLKSLKANDARIFPNNVTIVEEVNEGRLAAGLVNHYYVFEKAKEKGTTVEGLKARLHFFRGGDTGALVNAAGVGVLAHSANDPDTRAFVDYLLGTEAQTYFGQQVFEYPLVAGVPLAAGLPAIADLDPPKIDLNDLDTLQQTIKLIKESGLAP